jgi:hypothetical protein
MPSILADIVTLYSKRLSFRLGAKRANRQECRVIHDCRERALEQHLKLKCEEYRTLFVSLCTA